MQGVMKPLTTILETRKDGIFIFFNIFRDFEGLLKLK